MTSAPDADRLRRLRLAAQRLTPEMAASDARAATRTAVGVQAQDLRAARLALRSRVSGLDWTDVDSAALVRTWSFRGTAHLVDEQDLPWLEAVLGERNRRRFSAMLARRDGLAPAFEMADEIVAITAEEPRDRASLLAELAVRGHDKLSPEALNVIVPWAVAHNLVIGFPDGRLRPADPPPPVDEDEALATLARRYLEGYGPAGEHDMAAWSGLPLGVVRRALAAAPGLELSGELHAVAGMLDREPPPAPGARLLAAFDTVLLGYRGRDLLISPAHERLLLPGGGMIRPVVLVEGVGAGTWRLTGSGRRRTLAVDWFGRGASLAALEDEVRDIGRFLGIELRTG